MLTEKCIVFTMRNYLYQHNYVHTAKEMHAVWFGQGLLYCKIRNGINLKDKENVHPKSNW